MKPSRRAAIALVLIVIVAHAVSLRAGFIWDDDDYVTENRTLDEPGGLGRIWFELGATPQYYPLVHTTFWVEHRLWGERALGYHVVNVLLACRQRALVVLDPGGPRRSRRVAGRRAVRRASRHAESVAWITERKNVLSGLFYLGAMLAWLRFDSEEGDRKRSYSLSLLLFVCALLSKTITATLPAAFLIIVWWRRGRIGMRDVVPTLPFFALGAVAGVLTSWMERFYVGAIGGDWMLSFAERFQVAGRAVWFYLGKLVWPHPLMFIYPRWHPGLWGVSGWAWLVAAICLLAVLWSLRSRIGRGPLAAALFFGVTLGPALGFVNFYPMRFSYVADHFQYLASIGPLVLVAAVVAGKKWAPAVASAALIVLALLTWRQEAIYKDEVTLWRATLATNPNVFIAQNNLGGLLLTEGTRRRGRGVLPSGDRARADLPRGLRQPGDRASRHRARRRGDRAVSHRRAAGPALPHRPQQPGDQPGRAGRPGGGDRGIPRSAAVEARLREGAIEPGNRADQAEGIRRSDRRAAGSRAPGPARPRAAKRPARGPAAGAVTATTVSWDPPGTRVEPSSPSPMPPVSGPW
jgi:hypothetical protein